MLEHKKGKYLIAAAFDIITSIRLIVLLPFPPSKFSKCFEKLTLTFHPNNALAFYSCLHSLATTWKSPLFVYNVDEQMLVCRISPHTNMIDAVHVFQQLVDEFQGERIVVYHIIFYSILLPWMNSTCSRITFSRISCMLHHSRAIYNLLIQHVHIHFLIKLVYRQHKSSVSTFTFLQTKYLDPNTYDTIFLSILYMNWLTYACSCLSVSFQCWK